MIASTPGRGSDQRIVRLVGVYNADGTRRGEVAYWFGARLGRAHCELCDITHGRVRQRSEWKARRASLAVPFDTYHRDEQPEELAAATNGELPVVLAETVGGYVTLLARDELSDCGGSVEQLMRAIESAVAEAGLAWPG